ncbi:MAG: hypothetical protein HQL41_08815 [Alphaproteobacteria bacterium]|nr:hypothetical protein [Alphaproteobacteria bacterium]
MERLTKQGLSVRKVADLTEIPRRPLTAALDQDPAPRWVRYVVDGLLADIERDPGLRLRAEDREQEMPEVIQGDTWACVTARQLLPVLVEAREPMTYKELDEELARRHPDREPTGTMPKYGHPLGRAGRALIAVGERLGIVVPPLCVLVVNGVTKLPGEGLDEFLRLYLHDTDRAAKAKALKRDRASIVEMIQSEVLAFDRWTEMLRECGIELED